MMTTYCKHQGKQQVVKVKNVDGQWRVTNKCCECNQIHGPSIPKRLVDMDALDEFVTGYANPGCAVCNFPETQLHHWMPQSLARKAKINPDMWPTAYLCATCHDLWHRIVTPALLNRPEPRNRARHEWEAPKP